MFLAVCSDPDILQVMYIINRVIYVLKVIIPVIIVITGIITLAKVVIQEDEKAVKGAVELLFVKIFVGACVFFVPTFVGAIINIAAPDSDYTNCFENATLESIQKAYLDAATIAVNNAEKTIDPNDYSDAMFAVSRVKNATAKNNLEKRLKVVSDTIRKENEEKIREKEEQRAQEFAASQALNVSGAYSSSGNGVAQPGVYQNGEPDPSAAINYWHNYVNPNNFIYPRDEKTGLPLGAWPKNYGSIPGQLTSYNVYSGGFIWPCTPVNGRYSFVYEHNGMDIMAVFGTPIYSPVDGILEYSEWGHTSNRGGDETAYSASIKLNTPITAQGKSITTIFLTHMSGIRYRCARGACNRTVKKGELLGFVGNAAGTAQSVGWAPHLHMTFYSGEYANGLYTSKMQLLYGVNGSGTNIVAGG
ncbi:MAG: M23 family metallopeptidase [Firmicutes bacterium]|nr:M23 family metallopeptidase [Bacillota bacterium]